MAESQLKITDKNIDKTEAQLKKYYSKCFKSVVSDFEATYDKLLATVADGKQPTPADLYKLDRYWQLQAQLSNKLADLGDKQAKLLSKDFENQWKEVYDSIALPSSAAFNSMSDENARQMVNQVWCADGKSWSQRVWNNTDRLKEELNEELMKSVITGKDTRYLKNQLMERFSVSNHRTKTLVKTEMAHIQIQAAAQRYKDYGVEYYEFYADTDGRTCSQCGALDKKKFKLSEMKVGVNCPPMHPNDRCCIVPVIDKEKENDIIDLEIDKFVPCLEDTKTGEILPTEVAEISRKELSKYKEKDGWGVNWNKRPKNEKVFGLFIKGENEPQGLISLENNKGGTFVSFLSANPKSNPTVVGKQNKQYTGIGGHLFAIAVDESFKSGNLGTVYGYAANEKLLNHYVNRLGAMPLRILHPYHFIIDTEPALNILNKYTFDRR